MAYVKTSETENWRATLGGNKGLITILKTTGRRNGTYIIEIFKFLCVPQKSLRRMC